MSSTPPPVLDDEARTRNTLRVVGVALLLLALYLFGSGVLAFLAASTSSGTEKPRFGMLFLGLLLFAPAGWCLQAGFTGGASRHPPYDTTSTATDPPSYPSAGRSSIGGPEGTVEPPTSAPVAPTCRRCGAPSNPAATFCDRCGASLAG